MQIKDHNHARNLLHKVNVYHFAMLEAGMFLDSHPHDCEARKYFTEMQEAYRNARHEYVKHVGPLNPGDVNAEDHWKWLDNPWPWEGGDC